MRDKLNVRARPVWLLAAFALAGLIGLGVGAASAQNGVTPLVRPANTKAAVTVSGAGA
jgi:hypothetical protein